MGIYGNHTRQQLADGRIALGMGVRLTRSSWAVAISLEHAKRSSFLRGLKI